MSLAILSYSAHPAVVAIGSASDPSEVPITFVAKNETTSPVPVAQIVLTVPQGDGATDLLAPGSSLTAGSVHSSNGDPWSLTASGAQASLVPVASAGFAVVPPGGILRFTLPRIEINDAGAGSHAQIGVAETLQDGSVRTSPIRVNKVAPGFSIQSFSVDQFNVPRNGPVTVSWNVVGALSCAIEARVIDVGDAGAATSGPPGAATASGAACGVGTGNPACNGTIVSGTVFSGSNTCDVQGATVFTLTASGHDANGDTTLSSQLLVTTDTPAIELTGFPPAPSLGQTVTLSWVAANAARLELYTVPDSGDPSTEDITTSPSGTRAPVPQVDTTYYLYAYAAANDSQPACQQNFKVRIEQPQWRTPLTASGVGTPAYPGDKLTLTWAVANVASADLACDFAGIPPRVGLKAADTLTLTLPDPGVANTTATFTMTPQEFGNLGPFATTSAAVAITNLPYFSSPLAASPATFGGAGGTSTLTWTVERAETAVLSCNVPGVALPAVDPGSGTVGVTVPAIALPVALVYTLTATRGNGAWSSTSAATVQCTGALTGVWNCWGDVPSGLGDNWLSTLYQKFPNQRLRKIGFSTAGELGIVGLKLWYSDSVAPDYQVGTAASGTDDPPLTLAAGDYIASIQCSYDWALDDDNHVFWRMQSVSVTTAQGATTHSGDPSKGQPVGAVTVPAGMQAITIGWQTDNAFNGFCLICCPTAYGA